MTQWLLEEAAFVALDITDAAAENDAVDGAERQARLREMAERQVRR